MLVFYDLSSLDNDGDDDDDDDDDDEKREHLFKYEPCLGKVVKLYKLMTMFGLFSAVVNWWPSSSPSPSSIKPLGEIAGDNLIFGKDWMNLGREWRSWYINGGDSL